MKNITIKKIDDFETYNGEYRKPGIEFIYAGMGLGVESWGMNIIKMQAGATDYPEHDHLADNQEEVYFIIEGSAEFISGDERSMVESGTFVHVAPHIKRRFEPGENGVTILAIGGTPGEAYKRP